MEMATSSIDLAMMHHALSDRRNRMGSALKPALANIFVGYYDSKLFRLDHFQAAIWMTLS